MKRLAPLFPAIVLSILSLLGLPTPGRAANLTTTICESSGSSWNSVIWYTNGTGVEVGPPVAGNTYECLANGVLYGNGTLNTRVRTPTVGGVQTFPGDSLMLDTNTELRIKGGAANNFPGVNGNPGLILNGGILEVGSGGNWPITGTINVAVQSYLNPGNNAAGGTISGQSLDIQGQLSGSGTLVLFEGKTDVPQKISGNSNTFSGQWIVKAGWLWGAGTNSLGTNSITMDPGFVIPEPPFDSSTVEVRGPAWLKVSYPINSAGTLTLTNGGQFTNDVQNCCFTAVIVEGTSLTPGTHYWADLVTQFPGNFMAGGAGSITVQPYGTPPALGPIILTQPVPQTLYAGQTAVFTVAATGHAPLTYQWRKNGVNLTNVVGHISGATNATLTISSISSTDGANYDVVVSSSVTPSYSHVASLTVLASPSELYAAAVLAANPVAFYQFNDPGDPATNAYAFDSVGGFVGTYGTGVENGLYGIVGPVSASGFPGFAANNAAAKFFNTVGTCQVTVPAWNLNTNTVTITAWINPGNVGSSAGLVMSGGTATVAGLGYSSTYTDPVSGNYMLGYTWNNADPLTSGWNSQLFAPPGQWSFVALVVTPTNATIYLMNTNGLFSSTHTYSHAAQAFGQTSLIGDNPNDAGRGTQVFDGAIDDVAIFASALSQTQLLALFSAADGGIVNFPPEIVSSPTNLLSYAQQTAQFNVLAGGSPPLYYQWQAGGTGLGVFTNLLDTGNISGSATATLTINNISAANAADYRVVVTNAYGSVTSSPAATLGVLPTGPPQNITMSVQQGLGEDWNTGGDWSDGEPASLSAASNPGSTYEVLVGAMLRTPDGPLTATFPGNVLTLDGDGVYVTPLPGATISALRFKQTDGGTVIFPNLVMSGGELQVGNSGIVTVGGRIQILATAPFGNSTGQDEGYLVTAQLTGTGTIEYHDYDGSGFQPTYTGNLNVAGTSNTFSGKWNVVTGVLLGTGTNALGTNDITVGSNGALETTYDINNPNGNLFLNGRLFLHQHDTFRSVTVGGVALDPGTYTFAQLNAAYPANFPASWTLQSGSTIGIGTGSLTVLAEVAPVITTEPASQTLYAGQTAQFTVAAAGNTPMYYKWQAGGTGLGVFTNLLDTGNISGSATATLTINNISAANAADYRVVVTNAYGSVTSSPAATLGVLPTGPPQNITMSVQQGLGEDWNTGGDWSDGEPASLSAASNPGSTYEVLVGAMLRTPDGPLTATFPGNVLTLDGDGVYVTPLPGATISALRFKQTDGGTVIFPNLVMSGGELQVGNSGIVTVGGRIQILATAPFGNSTGQDEGYLVTAQLTGTGTIEYHDYDGSGFQPTYTGNLNVAGTSNTFSGKWNVVTGVLLGTGTNALGTNDITVGSNGALETTYDINNPNGNLFLNGRLFLHQHDTFRSVTVGGVALDPGTYTFAQLNAAYPANFPASWTLQNGSPINIGSGSLTVGLPSVTLQIQFSQGTGLQLSWSQGLLLQATNVTGPWTTNSSATSPFTVSPTARQMFYRVQVE
jgi:hypothetical protein